MAPNSSRISYYQVSAHDPGTRKRSGTRNLKPGVLLLCLLCFPATALAQDPTVRFALTDGAKVSDTTTVVARANCADDANIDRVEFKVDGQLKGTDTSTPYTFDWDTLSGTEGEHTLTATVYDDKGRSATATVKVTVDNELTKGADYHADAALAALKEGNTDLAASFARRALKIDPSNLKAARALAGIHKEKREYAQAIAVLEKASIPENDVATRADLVSLYMTAAAASNSTDEFLADANKAIDVYKKMITARQLNAANGGANASAPQLRGDALFAAHNWGGAVSAYQKCGESDIAPLECSNRLALAYIYAGRLRDAETVLHSLERSKRADDVTWAVDAFMMLRNHDVAKARTTVQDGVSRNVLPSLVVAAAADIVQGNLKAAEQEVTKADSIAPGLPEVQLLRSYVLTDPIDADHAVMRALELDPTSAEAYAAQGFRTLMSGGSNRFAGADAFFAFALKQDPVSNCALMGSALSLLTQRRAAEAEAAVNQLSAQDPNGADVHMVRALYFFEADKTVKVAPELDTARKIDPDRWNDALVPNAAELTTRIYKYRPAFLLTPAALYPAATAG